VLVQQLAARPDTEVKVFTATGGLRDHMKIFHWADVVVGPHGAGFSNLIFCNRDAGVVEIGWDRVPPQTPMCMDNMYSRTAAALGLRYRLLLGSGGYDTPLSLPPPAVVVQVESLLEGHAERG